MVDKLRRNFEKKMKLSEEQAVKVRQEALKHPKTSYRETADTAGGLTKAKGFLKQLQKRSREEEARLHHALASSQQLSKKQLIESLVPAQRREAIS